MEQETEKKRGRGRPTERAVPIKVFSLKADEDLVKFLEDMNGRNRFINEAIREKAIHEGMLPENVSDEKDG